MAIFVTDNALIGNYSVALNFVVLITFFALPVTTMLFPAFSKLDAQKDKETLRNVFQYSVKYATLIVVPVTVMVMALAQPAIGTIFENKYVQAPLYLALLSVIYLFSAVGSLCTVSLINGQGYTKYNLETNNSHSCHRFSSKSCFGFTIRHNWINRSKHNSWSSKLFLNSAFY